MDYKDIVKARKLVELIKPAIPAAKDYVESLIAVIDYADGCYVEHCEEVGRIAVEDIERMHDEWIDKACEYAKKTYGNKWFGEGREQDFRLSMKKDI